MVLGCHGGARFDHFPGTEHETQRCPRRHLLDHPDVVPIFALRRDVEGVNGLERRRLLTGAAVDALAIVADAVAWRTEQARKLAEKEAKR